MDNTHPPTCRGSEGLRKKAQDVRMMQRGREMKMFYCHVYDEDNWLHNKVLALRGLLST